MWARCVGAATRPVGRGGAAWACVSRGFSRCVFGREECRGWRKEKLWAAAGGSLFLLCAQAARHTPAVCLREGGLFLDPEDDQLSEASPVQMNEIAALTHTSLLKQASGVAVDAAIQLLHRTLRATLDFSHQHRRQLHEVIELLERCTTTLRCPEEHDRLWDLLVAARVRTDSLRQQLRDLNLLMTYACGAVENTAMAAYISGGEFSASAARQVTDSAKLELRTDERKTEALEMQCTTAHTRYIEAAQRMMEEVEARNGDDGDDRGDGEDDTAKRSGGGERTAEDNRQTGQRGASEGSQGGQKEECYSGDKADNGSLENMVDEESQEGRGTLQWG